MRFHRHMQQQEDWYAYLRLSPGATTEQIEQAVERLSRQATALAMTAPERSQLLRDTIRSIKRDLLSGPDSRQRYDVSRAPQSQPTAPAPQSSPPAPQPFAPSAQPFVPSAQPFASPAQPFVPSAQPFASPAQPFASPPQPDAPPAQPFMSPPQPDAPPAQPSMSPPQPVVPPAAPIPVSPAPAFTGERVSSRIARFLRTGWTCSACGKDALPSDKFCTKCGTPIKPVQSGAAPSRVRPSCTNCGAAVSAQDAFCARCGNPTAK
jgi:Double zinc ribbon